MDNSKEKTNAVEPHIFRMIAVYGRLYYVIFADNAKNDGKEGFIDHTTELVKGKGVYESDPNIIHIDERLFDIGIHAAYPRRDDPSRTVLLLKKESWMQYTYNNMVEDLLLVKKVTEELNASVDIQLTKMHNYKIALPVLSNAFGNKTKFSLDHFLEDEHVVDVIEDSNWILGPNFSNCGAAAMYFNPERKTFPLRAQKYGFIDKSFFSTPPTKKPRLSSNPRDWFSI